MQPRRSEKETRVHEIKYVTKKMLLRKVYVY